MTDQPDNWAAAYDREAGKSALGGPDLRRRFILANTLDGQVFSLYFPGSNDRRLTVPEPVSVLSFVSRWNPDGLSDSLFR